MPCRATRGSIRVDNEAKGRTLWVSTFIWVAVGRKEQGRANRFRIG